MRKRRMQILDFDQVSRNPSARSERLEAWELNILGIYDVVSESPAVGLEEWFAFLRSSRDLAGDVCEFGVFRGRSLVAAALLLKWQGDARRVVGFDTFRGFPEPSDYDDPKRFEEMAARGQISREHLRRVERNRELLESIGRSLHPLQSSTSGAFDDTSRELVEEKARLAGVLDCIDLFEGDFSHTIDLPENKHRSVAAVLIDSDLHDGYRYVLPWAWDRLVPGGMIFLDEYYSLKFPGPRIAVDEFCEDRQIEPTLLRSDGPFERWALFR